MEDLPKDPDEWTTDNVCAWLTGPVGRPPEETKLIKEQCIDGEMLRDVNVEDLREFGIHKLAHNKVLRMLNEAREEAEEVQNIKRSEAQQVNDPADREDIPKAQQDGVQIVQIIREASRDTSRTRAWIVGSGLFVELYGRLGILTNNHVIRDRQDASDSHVLFNYDQTCELYNYDGCLRTRLNPNRFYTGGGQVELGGERQGEEQGANTIFGNDWTFVELKDQEFQADFKNRVTNEMTKIAPYDLESLMLRVSTQQSNRLRVAENEQILCYHHSEGKQRGIERMRTIPKALLTHEDSSALDPYIAVCRKMGFGHREARNYCAKRIEGTFFMGADNGERFTQYRGIQSPAVQGGSSGSPVWDTEHRLIGILAGLNDKTLFKGEAKFTVGCHIDEVLQALRVGLQARKKAVRSRNASQAK